jgi:hypothetical protein
VPLGGVGGAAEAALGRSQGDNGAEPPSEGGAKCPLAPPASP